MAPEGVGTSAPLGIFFRKFFIMKLSSVKKVIVASPRGFCAGVSRAVNAVEDTIAIFGAPVYVKHQIVHNKYVVENLEKKGAVTIEEVSEIPDGAVVVFSAHGSPPAHFVEARSRGIRVIDATCPLVTKVHLEMQRFLRDGYFVVYIGHAGHAEGIGVIGEARGKEVPMVETVADVERLDIGNPEKIAYLTQTTLSIHDTDIIIEALKRKYPQIVAPPLSDICYATTNRQEAVRELARATDLVIILGSENSSNSTRLMETALSEGVTAYLIDDASALGALSLDGIERIGVSAGASAPEGVVLSVIDYFVARGATREDLVVRAEVLSFAEPPEITERRQNLSLPA
jgi:4-hydroxy-3-methylbut-2-enyl diphosphate reductase